MKTAFFAIALTVGAAAYAQDTAQVQPGMASSQTVAPANTNPETDARGIAVISDPAQVPAGWNEPARPGGTGAPPSATPAPMPATEDYPICSRTVTDNCVQAYERGSRRPR